MHLLINMMDRQYLKQHPFININKGDYASNYHNPLAGHLPTRLKNGAYLFESEILDGETRKEKP